MFRFASTALVVFGLLFPVHGQALALTDDRGVELSLTAPAKRVAAISTFGADLLHSVGMTPVAVTRFGPFSHPDYLGDTLKDVPVIGTRAQVNLELLSEVDPDLILAIRRYTEKDAARFTEIAPYLALNLITLDDSFRAVSLAGEALGKTQQADALNTGFRSLLADMQHRSPGGVSAALLVTGAEAPFIYYDHFLTAELLDKLNVTNVGGSLDAPEQGLPLGYRIRLETLLERDPDVIFLFDSNNERAFTRNPIWPYLSAVKNGRVYEVGQHWKEAAGPEARVLVAREMAHLLYPELFPMPEMPASLRSQRYDGAQH